jgi:hypothetical protein
MVEVTRGEEAVCCWLLVRHRPVRTNEGRGVGFGWVLGGRAA